MSGWAIAGIVAMVFGIIIGNILLIKHSNKFDASKARKIEDDDDDWPQKDAKQDTSSDKQEPPKL